MLILPHSPDSKLARQPWITWAVVALSLWIHFSQESNRNEVLISAATYCDGVFSDRAEVEKISWNNSNECAWDLADLHSLPDPEFIIDQAKNDSKLFSGWEPGQIESYLESLRKHYPAFALVSPPSLDAKLMYDPTVPNPWRMVTSALAHADWWHIIGNLIFFVAFAPVLELMAGRIRFVVILLVITIADSLTYSLVVSLGGWPAPTLGLSGVVFGMIGLAAYIAPRLRIRTLVWFFIYVRNHSIPAWVLAAWYVSWNIWDMFMKSSYGGTNFVAHVSGAVAGYLIGMFFMQKQRDDYADMINEEVAHKSQKRSGIPGLDTHLNVGNYKKISEHKQMQYAEGQYESQMEDIYASVRSENDSTAIMLLLKDHELWAESPEVYEEIFERMYLWGNSRALLCVGRLVIHLNVKRGYTARAQAVAIKCLKLDPKFALADRLDLGYIFQGTTDPQSQELAEKLRENALRCSNIAVLS